MDPAVQRYIDAHADGRWQSGRPWGGGQTIPMPQVDEFLSDVLAVCRRHKMSISHEDGHGAFLVVPFNEQCADWLANCCTNLPRACLECRKPSGEEPYCDDCDGIMRHLPPDPPPQIRGLDDWDSQL